jgi:hypothetical protein
LRYAAGSIANRRVDPFSDAIGLWYVDQYQASPPRIANARATTTPSTSLFAAPRNLFANTEWWIGSSTTIADNAAAAPDGTTSASSVVGTGNWILHPALTHTLPAGTYTLAANVKRNTGSDQQFAFYRGGSAVRSSAQLATSAWQRFNWTFTIGSPSTMNSVGLGSIDGSTAGNIQICDFEMYSGSSDLGPQTFAKHLYLGGSGFDTRPSYASGVLDLSSNGYGLIQFGASKTLSTFTVQALVSKTAAGSLYQSILSKVQSYQNFSAMTEFTAAPYSYVSTANAAQPTQGSGLWVALNKGYHVVTLRYDGTTSDWWLDDVRFLAKAQVLAAVTLTDLFFNITTSTGLYGGDKYAGAVALWDRALTDAEVRSAVTLQQARAAASSVTATSITRALVAEGDSIAASASPSSFAYLFGPNANPALHGVVHAVSGSTIATMASRAAIVDAVIPPTRTGRTFILSVLIGRNDLLSLGTSTWLTNLATYLDARRATGWKVVLCTVLPSTAVGFNAARNTANATLVTWAGVHADAIADFAADPTMGPDAAASNATYYSDGTHPTAAGQALLEPIYRAAVNSL